MKNILRTVKILGIMLLSFFASSLLSRTIFIPDTPYLNPALPEQVAYLYQQAQTEIDVRIHGKNEFIAQDESSHTPQEGKLYASHISSIQQTRVAEKKLGQAKNINDRVEAYTQLADAALIDGKSNTAIENYLQVVSTDPQNVAARSGLAEAYTNDGDYNQALTQLRYISSLENDNNSADTEAASIQLYSLQDPNGAIDSYQNALEKQPDDTNIKLLLASAYIVRQDYEQARLILEPILGQGGTNAKIADVYLQKIPKK